MSETNEKTLKREALNDQESEQVDGGIKVESMFGAPAAGSILPDGFPRKATHCTICGSSTHLAFVCPNRDSGSST